LAERFLRLRAHGPRELGCELLWDDVMSVQQFAELARLLGLLATAVWAAWTFHKLQRVRAAQLENDARLAVIEKTRLEQNELRAKRLRQQPQLAIQLEISAIGLRSETYRSILCISVVLKNEGEQNLRIEFQPATLTVGASGPRRQAEACDGHPSIWAFVLC
jgi:hypothetical protein